jgi:isoleucyl-tRNA synthetase
MPSESHNAEGPRSAGRGSAPVPPYPRPEPQADFPALERRILAAWEREGAFRQSVEQRPTTAAGGHEYVFYDGPPFANGLPHFGHLLTSYVKDVVPRYQTMRGRRVERRFGWDCHGLPAELEAERRLGVAGRQAILAYGIERFNAVCRSSVLEYTREWRTQVTRAGRWVDFDNDYKTMDLSFMESVLWGFKQLWDKGLVYEGYRVMPYSWATESPVSNFETRLDNAYRERDDPALTVRFPLDARPGDGLPLELWIWTTTPWTLPSNLAAAVGPEIEYVVLEVAGPDGAPRGVVIGDAARQKYERELTGATERGRLRGADLVGRSYQPPFAYFRGRPGAHRVLGAEFVDTAEGTGVVHLAPGFGEDDQQVCERHGIELVCPVDEQGRFTAEVPDFAGQNVLEANKPIAAWLKARGLVVRHEQYRHSYPHCWRTDQPLIYRAMSSWYVRVSAFRERMVELNRQIRWIPEHVRDGQFGKWLEGARDWSISRNRTWGTPIPIWRSDDPRYPRVDVYGSLDEMERDFGVRPTDLHRPFIDQLTRPNPDDPTGRSTMRRVEDVLDVWFDSGSMPFAQVHYPFEHKEWFEQHFPADFIVEYVAQTRGWFYTLMVLGTAIFDRPPFRNAICHGVVVAADGQKLSKRLRNYPPPEEVFERQGSDALRWHLMSSPILRGGDLAVSRDGAEFGDVVRLVLNPIWNAYSFFTLYANTDGLRARWRTDAAGTLDRYALCKARELVESTTRAMDGLDIAGACQQVRAFLDVLNNWYIRRSRPRFWSALGDPTKQDAYDTLYTCLVTLCRVAAPLLPFLTDEVHRGLCDGASVHLADWPDAEAFPQDRELVADMDRVRDVCSTALSLRESKRLRIRLPLPQVVVAGRGAERLQPYLDLVRDELNVKDVVVSAQLERYGRFELRINARAVGARLGGQMKAVLAAAKAGQWTSTADGAVEVLGQRLERGSECELALVPAAGLEGLVLAGLASNDGVVALDVRVTAELEREGLARDGVRLVQQLRKELDLDLAARIEVAYQGDAELDAALRAFEGYLREQTLAIRLTAVSIWDESWRSSEWAGRAGTRIGVRPV